MEHDISTLSVCVCVKNRVFCLYYFIFGKFEIVAGNTDNVNCILLVCWLTYHLVIRSFIK